MVFPANGTWLSTTEFGICITFIIICSTFVGLRLWARSLSRSFRLHVFTLSDVFVVIGYVSRPRIYKHLDFIKIFKASHAW